ncbi:MAG: DUF4367 domain-containing protein [Ruminiclostridium sp.]|nr:DUF4367 domain-containing protein [Ruminiclostridium sp.]
MNNKANNAVFDVILAEALKENCVRELSKPDEKLPKHEFSPDFDKKVKRLSLSIDRPERIKHTGKAVRKIMLSAAAAMGIVFCVFLTQPPVFASVERVIKNSLPFYDIFMFKGEADRQSFDSGKTFGYVPDGYSLRTVIYNTESVFQVYNSADDSQIRFRYGTADHSVITQETDSRKVETFTRNGMVYHYYGSRHNTKNTLLWYDDNCYYQLDAQLEKNELLKIAESIR